MYVIGVARKQIRQTLRTMHNYCCTYTLYTLYDEMRGSSNTFTSISPNVGTNTKSTECINIVDQKVMFVATYILVRSTYVHEYVV